jgi:hypothetical protein
MSCFVKKRGFFAFVFIFKGRFPLGKPLPTTGFFRKKKGGRPIWSHPLSYYLTSIARFSANVKTTPEKI